jgi:hypothetical protein
MVRGRLVLHEKVTDELGNTVEMKIWQVPTSLVRDFEADVQSYKEKYHES